MKTRQPYPECATLRVVASRQPNQMTLKPLVFSELNPPLNVTVIHSVDQLHLLTDYFSRVTEFVYDVETNVVDEFTDRKIRVMQIGDRNEQYVIDLLSFAGSTEALCEQGYFTCPAWAKPVVDALSPALNSASHLKLGVNLQFDYQTTYFSFGLQSWNFYDCWRVEQTLYAGKVHFFTKHFWGMEDLFGRYTGLEMSKGAQKTFTLDTPLTSEQIEYAAFDCRAPFAIRAGQKGIVAKLGLTEVGRIENNAIPAFGDMFLNGIMLSEADWLALIGEVEVTHATNIAKMDKYFIPVVGSKHIPPVTPEEISAIEVKWKDEKDKVVRAEYRKAYQQANRDYKQWVKDSSKAEGDAAINYGSHPMILAALHKMGFSKSKLPNTDDRTLKLLNSEPVIAALQDLRETEKLLDTYGRGFVKNINPKTGRVHSRIDQLGAGSGRTSSSDPNLQNIPSRTAMGRRMRNCFKARPGYAFVSADMSGAELRILAELSQDPIMIAAFKNGWDVHSVGAEIIFAEQWLAGAEEGCKYYLNGGHQKCKCKRHGELRDYIKNINFGIAYGMEAKKLSEDLGISLAAAKVLLEKWRAVFKVAWAYLLKSGTDAKMTMESRTASGRVRYYTKPDWTKCKEKAVEKFKKEGKNPDLITTNDISRVYSSQFGNIERQGKNTPMQGLNADILKLALGCSHDPDGVGYLWHQMKRFDAQIVLEVHDEADFEVREDQAEEFVAVVGDCYRRAAKEYMKSVQMESEGKIGPVWTK